VLREKTRADDPRRHRSPAREHGSAQPPPGTGRNPASERLHMQRSGGRPETRTYSWGMYRHV
jgi:hypothetical protein